MLRQLDRGQRRHGDRVTKVFRRIRQVVRQPIGYVSDSRTDFIWF